MFDLFQVSKTVPAAEEGPVTAAFTDNVGGYPVLSLVAPLDQSFAYVDFQVPSNGRDVLPVVWRELCEKTGTAKTLAEAIDDVEVVPHIEKYVRLDALPARVRQVVIACLNGQTEAVLTVLAEGSKALPEVIEPDSVEAGKSPHQ